MVGELGVWMKSGRCGCLKVMARIGSVMRLVRDGCKKRRCKTTIVAGL